MNNELIDLHMHTTASDGEYTSDELINKAINANVKVMAITDHDTIDGIKSVDKSKYNNINIINGIELTAKVDHGTMHILGYDIDLNNKTLNESMHKLKNNRFSSFISIIEELKRFYNIRFDYIDILNLLNSSHNLGRPDVAKLCVKYGYASNTQEAFAKYLNNINERIRKYKDGISYEECLNLIKVSDGIPVLAHPKTLKLEEKEFFILLKDMISKGLMGIEVYHSSHTKEEIEYYKNVAEYYNLLISGGSDFHGEKVKPDIEIGTGKSNNLKIKELSIVDYINNKIKK